MRVKRHTQQVHEAIVGSGYKIDVLAGSLDKAPSSLYNELNPYHEGTAKLGYDDALEILLQLKNPEPLRMALAEHNYASFPVAGGHDPLCHESAMPCVAECTASLGGLADTILQAMKDGTVDRKECLAIFDRVTDCLDKLNALGGKALAGAKVQS